MVAMPNNYCKVCFGRRACWVLVLHHPLRVGDPSRTSVCNTQGINPTITHPRLLLSLHMKAKDLSQNPRWKIHSQAFKHK
jgi:hypothetical protein